MKRIIILSITLSFISLSALLIANTINNIATATIKQTSLAQGINLSQSTDKSNMTSGIKGTVYLNGPDCPPTTNKGTALCSGPFAGHEVIIYVEDGKTAIKTVKTDVKGNYFVSLKPGHYIIYTQTGPLSFQREANQVIVKENQISQKDLQIESGIR